MQRLAKTLLAVLLLGVAGNQTLTRAYLFSQIGTLFTWSGSAQSGWNGSPRVATCADFNTYIKNDSTTCTATATLLDSFAIAHAVNTVTHSPILANNDFNMGIFTSWTSANTSGCNGTPFSGQNVPGYSGTGLAQGDSANCTGTPAVVNLAQTFTISGTPTVQTYSFAYRANQSTAGSGSCTIGSGAASMVFKINAVTVATIASPILDGSWHVVSGSTTHLANGSNTVELDATLTAATGAFERFRPGIGIVCSAPIKTAQPMQVDDFILSAVY